jgi:hypothetical protein
MPKISAADREVPVDRQTVAKAEAERSARGQLVEAREAARADLRPAFATREAARTAIAESIESFYKPRRRHSSLGCVSPLVFDVQHATAALAA